jgi:hypothetical protein
LEGGRRRREEGERRKVVLIEIKGGKTNRGGRERLWRLFRACRRT